MCISQIVTYIIVIIQFEYSTLRLDADFTVRLGDGALMSDFYPECYHVVYGAQRPVRWSALETLQGGLCTLPSNVVSVLRASCIHVFYCMNIPV